jgi:serine protease Do
MFNNEKKTVLPTILLAVFFGAVAGGVFGALAANGTLTHWAAVAIPSLATRQSAQSVNTASLSVEEESATINVVDDAAPAVVSIVETKALPEVLGNTGSPFNSFFFGAPQQQQGNSEPQVVGRGTGFLISKDGMILTNRHVVADAEAAYTVILNSGEEYDATVLARHPVYDMAIVKIEGESDFPKLELGDSDSVKVGQTVIAIGNALGEFRNTVTRGIVSGLGRTVTAGDGRGSAETLENVIQTDAAINQGNSGGPLMNLAGQVIGIDTAVSTEGQLVGFAMPINQAKNAIESVQKNGKIVVPFLGVRYTVIDDQVKKANDLSVDYGAILVKGQSADALAVVPGSPADKAGLVENDIILTLNDEKITADHSLSNILAQYSPGDTVTIHYLHDGEEKDASVVLAEREEDQ